MKIKSLDVRAVRWRDKLYGNTYFSAKIYVNGELAGALEPQYGYGDHYADMAMQWLEKHGYIKDREHYSSGGGETLSRYCQSRKIKCNYEAFDSQLKRDMKQFVAGIVSKPAPAGRKIGRAMKHFGPGGLLDPAKADESSRRIDAIAFIKSKGNPDPDGLKRIILGHLASFAKIPYPKLSEDATELVLFIENDSHMYERFTSFDENLARKIVGGKFQFEPSVKLWQYYTDEGDRRYNAEVNRRTGQFFPKPVRTEAARYFAVDFIQRLVENKQTQVRDPKLLAKLNSLLGI